MSMCGGVIGVFFNKPSEMWLPIALGAIPCAVLFSTTYILSGCFLSPPVGPLSKQNG